MDASLQLLTITLLLLFSQPILCLGDLEFTMSLQGDQAHSEVGTTEIDGEVFTLFLSTWVTKDERGDCHAPGEKGVSVMTHSL